MYINDMFSYINNLIKAKISCVLGELMFVYLLLIAVTLLPHPLLRYLPSDVVIDEYNVQERTKWNHEVHM